MTNPTKEAVAIGVCLLVAVVWAITTFACLILREYVALVTIQPVMALALGFLVGFRKTNGKGMYGA